MTPIRYQTVSTNELTCRALRLSETAEERGIELRLFGSCAVRVKCGQNTQILDRCRRYPKDIDGVVRHGDRVKLREFLVEQGWTENLELTAHTDGRQLQFRDSNHNTVLDISVDALRHAQILELADRLTLDRPTIPAADLLLSKLQIPSPTHSDLLDVVSLLHAVPLTDCDERAISLERIIQVVSRSWRWYKSVIAAFQRARRFVGEALPETLTESERSKVSSQLSVVEHKINQAPKSVPWRLRAIVGEMLPWRDDVEPVSP